jgi:hypothetical protein
MDSLKLIAVLLIAVPVFAQDQENACKSLRLQAQAAAVLAESPSATVSVAQSPSVSAPAQIIGGITESIQGIRKAKALKAQANTACALYAATEDATLTIQYLPTAIERDALRHRRELDRDAFNKFEALIGDAQRRVDAQNLTTPTLYSLQSGQARIMQDLGQLDVTIASMYVPVIVDRPIGQLVLAVEMTQAFDQIRQASILKTQDYDLQFEGGVHKPLMGVGPATPYVGFTFTYNIGARKADRLADEAAKANNLWKDMQEGGIQRNAIVLKLTLENQEHAQHVRLVLLRTQQATIQANLAALDGIDTTAALTFKTQLEADLIGLQVEIRDGEYRFQVLRDTLDSKY